MPYHGENAEREYSSQGLVADQLSVERGVNALFLSWPMVSLQRNDLKGYIWKLLTGMQETSF